MKLKDLTLALLAKRTYTCSCQLQYEEKDIGFPVLFNVFTLQKDTAKRDEELNLLAKDYTAKYVKKICDENEEYKIENFSSRWSWCDFQVISREDMESIDNLEPLEGVSIAKIEGEENDS